METQEILENYREQIDSLDKELLYLFKRRFEIVLQVWQLKKNNWIIPLQPERWEKLLAENIEFSKQLWLNGQFVIDIWNRIHDEALEIEK